MDKLKAVLAYKFWILFALALILPTYGWWSATGAIVTQTDTRKAAVDGSFTSVTQLQTEAPKIPNQEWIDGLKNVNSLQQERYVNAVTDLWKTQQALKTWPANIAADMATTKQDGLIESSNCFLYKNSFPDQIRQIYEIIQPIDVETNKGIVSADINTIESAIELEIPDGGQSPDSPAIWNAQEDIWLMTSIMESIARVNENANATSIADAPLKALEDVELRGGGAGGGQAAKKPAAGNNRKKKKNNRRGGDDDDVEPQAGARPGRRNNATYRVQNGVGFSGDDEFGPNGDEVRYVDQKGKFPYKKRGFILTVVVNQQNVPDLIAELTNMPFPTRIVRYQQEAMTDGLPGTAKREGGRGLAPSGRGRDDRDPSRARPNALDGFFGGGREDGDLNMAQQAEKNRLRDARIQANRDAAAGPSYARQDDAIKDAALADPILARVVIAGEMTIYESPQTGQKIAQK